MIALGAVLTSAALLASGPADAGLAVVVDRHPATDGAYWVTLRNGASERVEFSPCSAVSYAFHFEGAGAEGHYPDPVECSRTLWLRAEPKGEVTWLLDLPLLSNRVPASLAIDVRIVVGMQAKRAVVLHAEVPLGDQPARKTTP